MLNVVVRKEKARL